MADREKLIELQEKWFSCDDHADLERFAEFLIANGVTVQRHGKWIEHKWAEESYDGLISNYECSECHSWFREWGHYCSDCGAKMDGEKKMKYCETCGHYEVCKCKADYIGNCPDYITPVRHGKWIFNKEKRTWECSECHYQTDSIFDKSKTNYCPECGAKMED